MTDIQTKQDEKGILHDMTLSEHRVYSIFTKAGCYRGGKIYSEEKGFVIISGKCVLTMEIEDEDEVVEFVAGDIVYIEAGIPNIFFFPEDTEMVEWFPREAQIETYDRYTEIKDQE